jgi:hypothetical protein
MDTGSLEAELDGHAVRLGIQTFDIFYRGTHLFILDSVGIALLNITFRLPTILCPPPLTLFAPPVSFPLLHYLCHDTRLFIHQVPYNLHSLPPTHIASALSRYPNV